MYLEHFGLNEPPFRITPHTDFFFDGANRGATLDALIYAITHDEGIVKVSGEVGSGKTMLCRVLMERLPETVTIIYLANPSLSRDDILYAIADELRLDVPDNARSSVVMRALQDHLIKSFGEGRQVVVLIDEAHAMPVETLEEIRLLSNLEANRAKLLQLVLFGQPELNDVLARPDMRQLKERITHNFGLEPLVRDDITHYLDFRMRAAGYRGPSVFSPPALKSIEQSSLGLTRRINILADKALLAAFSSGSHQIGPKEIQAAIRDCEFSDATYGGKTARKTRTLWIAALVTIGALSSIIIWLLAASHTDAGTPAPAAGTAPVSAVGAPPASTNSIGIASALPAAPPAELAAAPGTAGAPPASTAPAAAPSASAATVGAPSAEAATPAAGAGTTPPSPATKPEPAVAVPPQPAKPKVGPLTLERLEAGNTWLAQLPDDRWFIQIFATDASRHGEIEALLQKLAGNTFEMNNVHVYYSELSGKPRYGVMYGNYSTREAAAAAIRGLPKPLRTSSPYPRQVVRLR
ncbi:MAG: AAA family ATPase [Sulfuritalea sp.]|jgi:type II secretory pathway predicted ATPase ExeA/septal ring-binding cell division protein DamX|nr:AAA family ATPase [Sulfuritalea sp.]